MKYVTHAELEAAIAGAARGIALGVREAMGSKPAAAQALRAKRLAFAVTDAINGVDLTMVGYICMAAGALGIVLSLIVNSRRDHAVRDSRRDDLPPAR